MSELWVIDLYCRMGGSTVGYQRADPRIRVLGVDREPQPGYPGDDFLQMDVIDFIRGGVSLLKPILIHAGPPCQEGNAATIGSNAHRGNDHPQLVPPTRALLDRTGIPYVIEQPASSRKGLIRRDLTLCMDMFKGERPPPWQQKHRSFELSGFTVPQPPHRKHAGYVRGHRHGVVRTGTTAPYVAGYGKGGGKATVEEMRHALGIDWMTDHFDLREAIPPAYTEYIGRHFIDKWMASGRIAA